ncbi:MAG: glycerate-2-kinase family protein, partial [Acidobacteriia bacterium]|nr:glycerate-2-kinase family protein [Terriglobia bacterium]
MGTPVKSESAIHLSYTQGKSLAQQIYFDTLAAIDVRHALLAKLKHEGGALVAGEVPLPLLRSPRVVALGKAACRMAAVLDEILSGQLESGVCVSPSLPAHKLERFRYFVGGHPYPNAGSLEGAQAALDLVSNLSADDFVVFLVSGGGSALFELPIDSAISLADLREFNRILVTCGLP